MRTWRTAGVPLSCGLCGTRIPPGEPFRAIWVATARARWVRCAACADREPPAPPRPDWKARATGER